MKYNFETLRSYALWYYFRYFPSVKRLQEKMLEKAKDQKLVEKVYKDIVHLTQEKQVMIDKIHIYLIRNKNLNYIRQQLMVKGFEKDMIGEILEEYFLQDGKSLLQENSLFIKIQNYKSSHKSLRFIRQKFIERPEDKDVVEEVISQVYPDGEGEVIESYIEKIKHKYSSQKLIAHLISRGFLYGDIKKYVK